MSSSTITTTTMKSSGRKRSAASTNVGPYKSVVDYDTEEQLRQAMTSPESSSPGSASMAEILMAIQLGEPVQKVARTCEIQGTLADELGWVLPAFDGNTQREQTVDEEMKRLQVIKSYLVLDAQREDAFDRISKLAARIFDVPISLITLVDLDRQWHIASHGVEFREMGRRHAFCSHAIMSKNSILVIPDASLDFRFKDNPTVSGPTHVRFYAGAPLVSPEGYKLGTLCIIDVVARPGGLSTEQSNTLIDLADMTVKVMVDRRYKLEKQKQQQQLQQQQNQPLQKQQQQSKAYDEPTQLVAFTAHDLKAPLTGLQMSLSLLRDDDELRTAMNEHHIELLQTAMSNSDLMLRICQNAIDGLYRSSESTHASNGRDSVVSQLSENGNTSQPTTKLDELVKNLHITVDPIPKKVPCVISLDPSTPNDVIADDLKLFRSALNLLTHAIDRTMIGSIHLTIRTDHDTLLIFECEDTGEDIPVEEYQYLFEVNQNGGKHRVGLSSIASIMNTMDGEFGFRPRGIGVNGEALIDATTGSRRSGSIFWFSIPLRVAAPGSVQGGMLSSSSSVATATATPTPTFSGIFPQPPSGMMMMVPPPAPQPPEGSANSVIANYAPFPTQPFQQQSPPPTTMTTMMNINNDPSFSSNRSALDEIEPLPFPTAMGRDMPDRGRSISLAGYRVENETCDDAIARLTMTQAAIDDVGELDEDSKLSEIMKQLADIEPYPIEGLPAGTPDGSRRKRALIIDDSRVARRNLAQAFQSLGFDIVQASDGMEGLQQMQQSLFDIVMCDFVMPVMDGINCVWQFREWEKVNRPWDHQWIVGISGHTNENDGGRGIQAGMDMFYPKPITVKNISDIQGTSEVVSRGKMLDEWESNQHHGTNPNGTVEPTNPMFGGTTLSASTPPPTSQPVAPICLIASNPRRMEGNAFPQQLESMGWKVYAGVSDGQDCLRLLQLRQWGAVLIDDDLPQMSGVDCIAAFRQWESRNRPYVQKNVFLVCDGNIPSPASANAFIQPPNGCNGVLRRPIPWDDFEYLLNANKNSA